MIFKITPAKYNTFGDFYLPGLLGGTLGLPWGWLGALLGPTGASWRLFGVPVGPSGQVCRVPNGFWGPLVAHLAAVLWPLVVPRGALGSSWGRLGALVDPLGTLWRLSGSPRSCLALLRGALWSLRKGFSVPKWLDIMAIAKL